MIERPNILMILTDQQRQDSLACYGNPVVETPNIDRLAANGLRFTRNYVANPICMPNRMSMATGLYPRNHGLWTNGLLLDTEHPSLASQLSSFGYHTASIGKIHATPYGAGTSSYESTTRWGALGDDFDDDGPYHGYEHVELTLGHTEALAHYGRWFRSRGGREEMMQDPLPTSLHDSTFVGERAADFIRTGRDPTRPFFLVASFPDPHAPFNAPHEVASKYDPGMAQMPIGSPADLASRPAHYRSHYRGSWHRSGSVEARHPDGFGEAETRRRIANTYAMVDLIDQNVGTILGALDDSGESDRTVVVFTSDHGELLGDFGLWMKGPFFYEGLIRTPLIIRVPWLPPAVHDGLISDVDLTPTLLDLVGAPVMPGMDGISHLPQLEHSSQPAREWCLVEYRTGAFGKGRAGQASRSGDQASFCLVTGGWKYVVHQSGERELTDLGGDPGERRNLAGKPGVSTREQQMQEQLLEALLATQSRRPRPSSYA